MKTEDDKFKEIVKDMTLDEMDEFLVSWLTRKHGKKPNQYCIEYDGSIMSAERVLYFKREAKRIKAIKDKHKLPWQCHIK